MDTGQKVLLSLELHTPPTVPLVLNVPSSASSEGPSSLPSSVPHGPLGASLLATGQTDRQQGHGPEQQTLNRQDKTEGETPDS